MNDDILEVYENPNNDSKLNVKSLYLNVIQVPDINYIKIFFKGRAEKHSPEEPKPQSLPHQSRGRRSQHWFGIALLGQARWC